jgi:hypothetical protein
MPSSTFGGLPLLDFLGSKLKDTIQSQKAEGCVGNVVPCGIVSGEEKLRVEKSRSNSILKRRT